uniref:Acylphosphatase n=1 Tax=Haemonchus placei TaxID=6290 RepID=A0A0N4X3C2_HAEPC
LIEPYVGDIRHRIGSMNVTVVRLIPRGEAMLGRTTWTRFRIVARLL